MGNRYPPREGSVSDCKSTQSEYGSNNSHRSYPRSSSSSETTFTNVNYTNAHNPNIQYQTRTGSSSSDFQYPQSQYTQSQYPQAQYHQAQYSQAQYPQAQYSQSQYPRSHSGPASNSQQQLPLTQQTLHANHTQYVDPLNRQQREQQQYASRVAAAQSMGIDTSDPMLASVTRERPQASRPIEAYASEPGPRYLSVAPLQASRGRGGRGTRR